MTTRQPGHTRRVARWLAWTALAGLVALILLYATFPWWASKIAPYAAQRAGIEHLSLTVGRPELTGLSVARLEAATATSVVQASEIRANYSWSSLLRLRLDGLDVGQIDVALRSADAPPSAAPAPTLPRVPVDVIDLRALVLRFPDTGFVGSGSAQLDQTGLTFAMRAQQPEAVSMLDAQVSLTREGEFYVRIGERDSSQVGPLQLRGTLSGERLIVNGNVQLEGLPLLLTSRLLGLPEGDGHVSAAFATTLAWPLPESLQWQELDGQVTALSLDWTDRQQRLALKLVDGHARFNQGNVTAQLSGEALYRFSGGALKLSLPADYALDFAGGTLRGTAGPAVVLSGAEQTLTAAVRSFSLQLAAESTLDVDADVQVALGETHASAHLLGHGAWRAPAPDDSRHIAATLRFADRDDADLVSLDGTVTASAVTLAGPFRLSGPALDLVATLVGAPAGAGYAAGTLRSDIPLDAATGVTTLQLSALEADWTSADGTVAARKLRGAAEVRLPHVEAQLSGSLAYAIGPRIFKVRLPAGYALAFDGKALRGGAGMRLTSALDEEKLTAYVRRLSFQPAGKRRLEVTADVDAQTGELRAKGQLDARVDLLDMARPRANATLGFDGTIAAASQTRAATLQAELVLSGDTLGVTGTAVTDGVGRVPFRLDYNTASAAGTLGAAKRFEFFGPAAPLFLPDWNARYDIDSGAVDVDVKLNWQSSTPVAAQVALVLDSVGAHYDEYRFAGIAAQLRLRTTDITRSDAWQLEPTLLNISRIDVGVPLHDAVLGLHWSGNRLSVTNATASLLGGRVSTAAFDYDTAAGSAAFDLLLSGMDLAQVLALEGEDISGSGVLDGTIPIALADNQPTVTHGVLGARPPGGTVSLSPRLASSGRQDKLDFALTALQDFRYSMLNATIDYVPNGDLTLGVTLQGYNPEVEKGRPIHYNLNISENLPALLESLRLKDRLNQDIERRFNQ